MDLNQLLFEHQVALIRARGSLPGASRNAYSKIAAHYARRLRAYRRSRQVQQYGDYHNDDLFQLPRPKGPSVLT